MRTVISYILLVLLTSGVVISKPDDPVIIQELTGKVKNNITGLPVTTGNIKIIDYSTVIPTEIVTISIKSNGTYKVNNFQVSKPHNVRILAYPSDIVWDGGYWRLAYSPTGGDPENGGGNNYSGFFMFNLNDATITGNVYNLDLSVPWSDLGNKSFKLNQNFPNPFNPVTSISFELPVSLVVSIKVYDIIGNQIAVLAENKYYTSGYNEIKFDASNLASGIYFYEISSTFLNDVKKMTLIK